MFDGFQSPLFLMGLLGAAIPVVLHLIYRKRAPRMLFSTLRFLRQAAQNMSRRKRIENWLLLALRVAVIALLALALSGPLLRSGAVGQRGALSGVIVLDNSASMATEHDGETRFAQAKRLAAQLVDDLSANGDPVTVILTNPTDGAEAPSLADSPGQARQRIDRARIVPRRAALGTAFERAANLLADSQTPANLLAIVTDSQAIAWDNTALPERLATTRNLSAVVVDCHRGDFRNLGIGGLEMLSVDRSVGRDIALRARIVNASAAAETGLHAHLFVDGEKIDSRAIEIGPRGSAFVEFRPRFTQPGLYEGRIWLDARDSLPLDDTVYFALDVAASRPALVVAPPSPGLAAMGDAFYLNVALDPFRAIGEAIPAAAVRPVHLETAAPGEVTAERLETISCVFVVSPEYLTDASREALWRYVHDGGGLVAFPGPQTTPEQMEAFLSAGPGGRRGCPVGAAEAFGGAAEWTAGAIEANHPLLHGDRQWDIGAYFDRLRAGRFIGLTPGSTGRVLAWLMPPDGQAASRQPLMIEADAGRGRVLVFALAPRPERSTLAQSELMLILSHRSVYYLSPDPAPRRMLVPGEAFAVEMPAGGDASLAVTGPDGVPRHVPFDDAGPIRRARYTDTGRLGPYRYTLASGGREREGLFAVNHDPAVSDLRALGEAEILDRLAGASYARVERGGEALAALMNDVRQGRSLAPVAFILVILLALVECFMANRIAARAAPASPSGDSHPARPLS